MSHLYFVLYAIALLCGALLLPNLYVRYQTAKAFFETFMLYVLLSVLVLLGACTLYIAVNVSTNHLLFKVFMTGVFCNIAGFIYLSPRQHHVLFGLAFNKLHHYLLFGLAALAAGAGVSIWFVRQPAIAVAIPLVLLIGVLIYCQVIYVRFYSTVFTSPKPKIIALLLPILAISLGLLEGFEFGDGIVSRGVIVSLPIIYIAHCASMWWLRDELFPTASANAPEILSLDQLTAKEREIVQAVLKGMSNKQIAADFGLSPSTVKNHLYAVFKKLGVTNRYALINRLAIRE